MKTRYFPVFVGVLILLVIGLAAFRLFSPEHEGIPPAGVDASESRQGENSLGPNVARGQTQALDLNELPYSAAQRVGDINEAVESAAFRVHIPSTAYANTQNVTDVFVLSTGAVVFDFPSPGDPVDYIRQNYIEIYQSPWTEEEDPASWYKQEFGDVPGQTVTTIDGIPAVTVDAHSAEDVEKANAAFVRFVLNGTEVQISGTESLDLLIDIAMSMINNSGSR